MLNNELAFVSYLRGAPYPIHINGGPTPTLYVNQASTYNWNMLNPTWLNDSFRLTGFTTNDLVGNQIGGDLVPGGWRPIVLNTWMDAALANPQILGPNCVPDFDPVSIESWPNYLHSMELCTFFSSPLNFEIDNIQAVANFEIPYSNCLSATSIKIRRDLTPPKKLYSTNGVDFIAKPNNENGIDLLLVNRNYSEMVSPIGNIGTQSQGPGYLMDLFTNTFPVNGTNWALVFAATNVNVSFNQLALPNAAYAVWNAESDGHANMTNFFNVVVPAGSSKLFRLTPTLVSEPAYRVLNLEKWFYFTNYTSYPNYPGYGLGIFGSANQQLYGNGTTTYSNALQLETSAFVTYSVDGASTFTATLGAITALPTSFTNLVTVFIDGSNAAVWLTPNSYATNVSLAIPAGAKFISLQTANTSYGGNLCYVINPTLINRSVFDASLYATNIAGGIQLQPILISATSSAETTSFAYTNSLNFTTNLSAGTWKIEFAAYTFITGGSGTTSDFALAFTNSVNTAPVNVISSTTFINGGSQAFNTASVKALPNQTVVTGGAAYFTGTCYVVCTNGYSFSPTFLYGVTGTSAGNSLQTLGSLMVCTQIK